MMDKLELMHALADGQLSAEEQQRAEQLAATDPQCANELKWAREIKGTVAAKCRMEPDRDAWQTAVKRLDALDKTKTTEQFVGKFGWAFCAVVFAAILFGAVVNRNLGTNTMSSVQVAELFNPVTLRTESAGTNIETARILNLQPYRLVGEATMQIDGRPCRYLRLQDTYGNLALVGVQGTMSLEGIDQPTGVQGFRSGSVNGANCVTWTMSGNTFVLASNRPTGELLELARGMIQ